MPQLDAQDRRLNLVHARVEANVSQIGSGSMQTYTSVAPASTNGLCGREEGVRHGDDLIALPDISRPRIQLQTVRPS